MSSDTIFAPATAPGKSGVAIVRVSGPMSAAVLEAFCGLREFVAGTARYVTVRDKGGHIIDKGLALCFKAPASFTGEDSLEFQLHGSPAVMRQMLTALSSMPGLRFAEPGEFSRRAFLNGKMDLLEAEGLADLIDAETPRQKAQAQAQMDGVLSGYYGELRARMVQNLAMLEAYIDFPEEEIPDSVVEGLEKEISGMIATMEAALFDHKRGQALREGMRVVILGAPNAGKSSLLNSIAKKDAAIVSSIAGTTRDVIEIHMDMAGFPVILTDTAGLREAKDEIEIEGVRRAEARAGEADLKLVVLDGAKLPEIDAKSLEICTGNYMILINKIDMKQVGSLKLPKEPIGLSAKTGEGFDGFLTALKQQVSDFFSSAEAPVITRARHRELLTQAHAALKRFSPSAPLELACENLRIAAKAVGKITGKIEVDELLDVIFKQFCIGK